MQNEADQHVFPQMVLNYKEVHARERHYDRDLISQNLVMQNKYNERQSDSNQLEMYTNDDNYKPLQNLNL